MKNLFLGTALLIAVLCNAQKIKYGALIVVPDTVTQAYNFKMNVANQLGISCLRDQTVLTSPRTIGTLSSNYSIILNIKAVAVTDKPVGFVTDTILYKQQLKSLIKSFPVKPKIVVIENEACNANYYNGSAKDYINQLRAAVSIFHAFGIAVADAGTTDAALKYLLTKDMTKASKDSFAQRMGGTGSVRAAIFADSVMNALHAAKVDYANFHWYQDTTDTRDLEAAYKYVKTTTGLPVICNEMGQNYRPDAAVVSAMIKKTKQLHFRYVLWYSGNSNNGVQAKALHLDNGALDTNGEAFKKEIAQ